MERSRFTMAEFKLIPIHHVFGFRNASTTHNIAYFFSLIKQSIHILVQHHSLFTATNNINMHLIEVCQTPLRPTPPLVRQLLRLLLIAVVE